MVTEAIWQALCSLVTWFLGLFPTWDVPAWWSGNVLTWLDGLAYIQHFGAFIPLTPIAVCSAALLTATVIVTLMQASRVVYSMVTGGGGAT